MSGINGARGFFPLRVVSAKPKCSNDSKSMSFEDLENLLLSPFNSDDHVAAGAKKEPNNKRPSLGGKRTSSELEKRCYTDFLQKLATNENVDSEDEDGDYELTLKDEKEQSVQHSEVEKITNKEIFELFADTISEPPDESGQHEYMKKYIEKAEFTDSIRSRIEAQLNIQFQLLFQTLALAGEVKDTDNIQIAIIKMMFKLGTLVKMAPYIKFKLNSPYISGLDALGQILIKHNPDKRALLSSLGNTIHNDSDLRSRCYVVPIPFQIKTISSAFWHLMTIAGSPYDPEYSIIREQEVIGSDPLSIESLHLYLGGISGGRRVDSFRPIEDKLLLLGLKRFGLGNWMKIQAHFIPTRSARQIYVRYKNMISRKAAPNQIKDFVTEVWKPLGPVERDLIIQGHKLYGQNWYLISARFLPHRPAAILRSLWKSFKQ